MKLCIVVTSNMLPLPDSIKVIDNWGYVGVVDSNGRFVADGDHMYLEGTEAAVCEWLSPFDAIWRTKPGTSPMFQQFEAVHIEPQE